MKNPWLAWYPGDYISKTRHLTMAQHGAYTLLLWDYYINGPLLANGKYLLNICCGRTTQDEFDMLYVIEHFFVERDGFYHHDRADEEIKRRESIREQRKEVGRRGGLAKARSLLKQKPTQSQLQSQLQTPTPKAKAPSAFEMPNWVPKEAWKHYEEMRKRIRKPMTDQARKWAAEALDRLRVKGFDPAEVLEQSVFNSWQGLFEVRNDSYKASSRSEREQSNTQARRALNNFDALREAFEVGEDSTATGTGQAPRSVTGNHPLLEGKTKTLP